LVNNLVVMGSYAVMVEAMQLGAAYGLDEDTVATFITAGEGDSRQMRVWGRHDRTRRERAAAGIDWAERMGRDLLEAARAAGLQELTLPIAASAGQMMPFKLRQRDRELDAKQLPEIPRCPVCHWELAAPFRTTGMHPECVVTT
jgi:3-hydroxyisobutyrate dehydrogenase-like beta-hydroxyacid dehydrogenase